MNFRGLGASEEFFSKISRSTVRHEKPSIIQRVCLKIEALKNRERSTELQPAGRISVAE